MPNDDETSITDLVRECLAEAARQRGETVADGGRVSVPLMLRDGQSQNLGDAYDRLVADRVAYFQARDAELAEIAKGIATPAFTAACEARDKAWQKRGEDQVAAWQQRPSPPAQPPKPPASNTSLADALAARDAAWRKRGEEQANAWRR